MAEIRTRALVLRCYDQRESDRLVHLYTEAQGRVAAVAKGARRSRRRFPGTLEILTLIDTRLADPPRSALMRLEGAKLLKPFEGLVNHLGRYAIACQLAELLDRITGEREANPELFHFASGVLDVLRLEAPDRLLALLVLTKTLARLGYRPLLVDCSSCGRTLGPNARGTGFEARHGGAVCAACREPEAPTVPARLLLALDSGIRSPLRDRGLLGLDSRDVARAELLLERFFRYHIGLELRTMPFLRQVVPPWLDAVPRRGENASPEGGAGTGAVSASAPDFRNRVQP